MGSNAEVKAATYFGPVAVAASPGALQGVVRYATTGTTAIPVALPTAGAADSVNSRGAKVGLQGKYLNIKNESTSVAMEFVFGIGSAPALVYGTTSTFASTSAAAGWRLSAGETISVIVPPDATHIVFAAASGTDTIAFYCSEGNVGNK